MVNYLKISFSKVSSSYIIFLHLIAVLDLFGFLYIKFLLRLSSLSPWSETKQHVKATGPKLIKEIDPVVVRNVSGSWWPEEYNGTLMYLSLNCLCIYIWLLGGAIGNQFKGLSPPHVCACPQPIFSIDIICVSSS